MLVFDELKKNDPQLRFVAMALAAGLFILLAGLWWVQIVSGGEYQSHLETQSYRTIRMPAMRGKILDREGRVMAENAARYNLSLYLGDLSDAFQTEYDRLHPIRRAASQPFWKFWSRSSSTPKAASLSKDQIAALTWQARDDVAYGVISRVSQTLGQPLTFDPKNFQRAYESGLYVPYPILQNLTPAEIARFEENYSENPGVDLEVQTTRLYPLGMTAAHVLGYVQKDDSSIEGEDSFFNYRLPDYRGVVGIEGGFDSALHGHAGEVSVMVNNLGYSQTNDVEDQPEPGHNAVLTIDLDIQRAAEESLAQHQGADARAAIVVMNVRTGDILAMVSSPGINPNYFTGNLPPDEMQKESALLDDPKLRPLINRASYENYAPGSIFKPIVGLAALDNGLNPDEIYQVQPDPADPDHGCIYIGARKIKDTVHPGDYDFKRAIAFSSNSYFIYNGLRTGIEKIITLGEKFHFGEKTGLPTMQETRGIFPSLKEVQKSDWRVGDSANICFGQGQMAVTPIQIAVAYSAIANGGSILWPRLVDRVESQDPASGEAPAIIPSGVVRDRIGVRPRSLRIVRDAMLDETENGTGKPAVVPGLSICGKTGTAQVQDENGKLVGHNYWFASFAPYESPKYTVIVMVQSESGGSGGSTCAPIAHDIYAALVEKDPTIAQHMASDKLPVTNHACSLLITHHSSL
jgi:penicillin-binding protein 2